MEDEQTDLLKYFLYKTDPVFFMKDALDLIVKDFHEEWVMNYQTNNYLSLNAPRGHGKTTILGGYIIWLIVNNPNIRILIVTCNQNKADEMMSYIQWHLENNPKIENFFGEQKGYPWSTSKLKVAKAGHTKDGGFEIHKEPTLQVLGVSSSSVSSHYDMIILDDIMDEKNSRTPTQRGNVFSWYESTLTPMLEPGGKIFNICTRWHQNDIHNYLTKKPMFKEAVYKALIHEPEDDDDKPIVLWEERMPYYDQELPDGRVITGLKTIREANGAVAFEMQYQNNIAQTEDSPIRQEWVDAAKERYVKGEFAHPSPSFTYYMGVDLASEGKDTDYFAITIIGIDEQKNIHVVKSIQTKKSMSNQLNLIRELDHVWNPAKIGVESVASQKIITDEWQKTTLPIVAMKSSWVNNHWSRVQRLSVLFETGRILMNPYDTGTLELECISFPRGAHDDAVDSLSFAVQLCDEGKTMDWDKVRSIVTAKRRWNVKT